MPTSAGTPERLLLDDVGDDGVVLFLLGAIDGVRFFLALHDAVGRNDHHVELVDAGELLRFGVGRAGHAGQLLVLAEVVLERDRRERLVLALDLHSRVRGVVFLGFDRLVQAVAPAPARHQPAGELVDDDDFLGAVTAVLHHVLDVEVEQRVRAQRLVDVVKNLHVDGIVEPVGAGLEAMGEYLLRLRHPGLGQVHRLVLLVDDVVAGFFELLAVLGLHVAARHAPLAQARDDVVHLVIQLGRFLGRTGNDQRRPGLVDQDRVHLVDDREIVPALHVVRELVFHVVAQVVEAELVVRAVGDVGGVGDLAFRVVQIVLNDADRHAEEAVDPPHPLGVAAGQVVVDGDDVDPLAGEGIEIGGEGRDQRLAFAGLHLRDLAAVQHHAADQLHVEVPHVQRAAAGLADDGEGLGQQVVERLSLPEARPEFVCLGAQLFVRERFDGRLERVDLDNEGGQALQFALVGGTEDFRESFIDDHRGWISANCITRFARCRAGRLAALEPSG